MPEKVDRYLFIGLSIHVTVFVETEVFVIDRELLKAGEINLFEEIFLILF